MPLLLGLGVAVGATGCAVEAEPTEEEPEIHWWYVEEPPRADEQAYRTAMLLSYEGWNGSESKAPRLGLISQLYPDDSLLIEIGLAAQADEARCSASGCYLYARLPGGEWKVLRAVPRDEDRHYLVLSNPWTLFDLMSDAPTIEVEVPLLVRGACTYTLQTHGYRVDLHKPAGPASINGDGSPRERIELTDEDNEWLEGPPGASTVWPRCSGAGT